MLEERKKCAELTDKVLSVMLTDNYSRKSVNNHIRYVYCALTKFCDLFDQNLRFFDNAKYS